jgi:hypothetical protein
MTFIRSNNQEIHSGQTEQVVMLESKINLNLMHLFNLILKPLTKDLKSGQKRYLTIFSKEVKEV